MLTLGENHFISCVSYFYTGKLKLLMNSLSLRLSPELDVQIKHCYPLWDVTCLVNVYYINSNKKQGTFN